MEVFLSALAVFAIALAGMAIGVLVRRKPLKGTCGGLNNLSDQVGIPLCDVCEGDPDKRPSDCEWDGEALETASAGDRSATEG